MIHVTRRLTAKNWDQLRNPTPGNASVGNLYLYILVNLAMKCTFWG